MEDGCLLKIGLESKPVLAPETFEQLLHHSYLIASDVYTKGLFFHQQERKVSSTLLLLEMMKNWGHPCTLPKYRDLKKGRPANNLLLLQAEPSWNQGFIKEGDLKFKAFESWADHAIHVSDLLTFRPNFFNKYSLSRLDLCYDIDIDLLEKEYWRILRR